VLLVTTITILAAGLRFTGLASQSLWFDEAQAVHEVQLSFGAMLHAWSASEPNPPLYFVIAWPWARVFGSGPAAVRALSAVCGTATVPLVYGAGRELVSRQAGRFAALLAALSPFLIWYSQEAREYMLLTALSAASVLCFARAWHGRGRRPLAWWSVIAALALLTQYFALFLIGAEALALAWRLRSRALATALALAIVVELALIPHLLDHISHPSQWIASAGSLSVRVQQVPIAFAFNTLYRGTLGSSDSLLGAAVLAAVLIALLVAGADGPALRGAGLAALLAAAVVLVPLLLAVAGHDLYEARALIPGWIPLVVLVGAACAASRARVAGAALALVLCAAFVWAQVTITTGDPVYRRADWKGVAAALGRPDRTRAVVAFDGQFAAAPLALYLPGVRWTGSAQFPQTSTASVTVDELDIEGDAGQTVAVHLPPGVTLISARRVDDYLADRFALGRPRTLTRSGFAALAATLLAPADPTGAAVLVEQPAR
jgi:uncharacterized membrane protein